MRILRLLESRLLVFILASAVLSADSTLADTIPAPDELLRTMRAFDSAYRAGLTVSGTEELCPYLMLGDEKRILSDFTVVLAGKRMLVDQRATEIAVPPEADIAPPLRRLTLFLPDHTARLSALVGSMEQAKGLDLKEVEEKHATWTLALYPPPPDDFGPITPLAKLLWVMGRGFSDELDRIDEVQSGPNGQLRCTGHGTALGVKGRWELTVDPKSGYLVRSASFFRGESDKPFIEVANMGLQAAGGRVFPQSGTWTAYFFEEAPKLNVTFKDVQAVADVEQLRAAEEMTTGPMRGPTTVSDSRVSGGYGTFLRPGEKYEGFKPAVSE